MTKICQFVSFWQYYPHSSDCFSHSFSSQEFGKTSLWNKYHSLPCDFWKFVGKTHHSCKFLGHSRINGLSWPKKLHSLWVFSSLIFLRSCSREIIICAPLVYVTSPWVLSSMIKKDKFLFHKAKYHFRNIFCTECVSHLSWPSLVYECPFYM